MVGASSSQHLVIHMCLCCHVGFLMASKWLLCTYFGRSSQHLVIHMCLCCHVGFLMASKRLLCTYFGRRVGFLTAIKLIDFVR